MQPARSPVQTRSRVAATREPLWEPPNGAKQGSRSQASHEPPVEAVDTAPVGAPWEGTSFSQAVGVAGGGFYSFDDPEEMEVTGEGAQGFSKVKFNGKNATMRVSELRQIHQREVGTQSGRRSYNTAIMTQTEKHSILMGLVEGEAYTALRDHFRAELDEHALARELADRRNRAREDNTQERWERLHDAYLREVDRIDSEVAARAAAEVAAQRAREEAGLLAPVDSASFAPAAPAAPVVYPAEPIHRVPPKLSAPDIPDIMDQAWAFLERTLTRRSRRS
jgi:hypothetical protein